MKIFDFVKQDPLKTLKLILLKNNVSWQAYNFIPKLKLSY